jgi:hypothetical protein
MARATNEQKPAIMRAITEHLNIHGPANYDELMAKFPEVSRPTFYRWLKEAKDSIENVASEHGTLALQLAQKRIRSDTELSPLATQEKLKAQLPAIPSPAIVAGLAPGAVKQTFNFIAFFYEILADIALLRSAAVKVNDDGTQKLVNPMLLDKVVGKKRDMMDTYIRSQEFLFGLEQMEELFRVVIDEIGKVSPEVQQAIMVRMRGANDAIGFNANARFG